MSALEFKGAPGRITKYTGDEQKVRAGDDGAGALPPRKMVIHNVLNVTDARFRPMLAELFPCVDFDALSKTLAGKEKSSASAMFFRAERKLPPLTLVAADPTGDSVYRATNARPSGKPSIRVSKNGDRIEMPLVVVVAVEREATLRIRDAAGADLVFNVSVSQTEIEEHIANAQTTGDPLAAAAPKKKGKSKSTIALVPDA